MARAKHLIPAGEPCEIIDFDEFLLSACALEEQEDLIAEAQILAQAFADDRSARALEDMAATLSAGERDDDLSRSHARRIAAALKRLARDR